MVAHSDNELINKLSEKFKKERKDVSLEIKAVIEKMASFNGLKEVQIEALSMRQRLLETMHSLLEHQTSVRKKHRAERSKELKDLSTNSNYRYQYNEKNVILDGMITVNREIMELLDNQISFYVDSMKTVDNILYGLKTRVEIEKSLGL